MLRRDAEKWAVPGEWEYAIQKDAEIEAFLLKVNQLLPLETRGEVWECGNWRRLTYGEEFGFYPLHIWITEHIMGGYCVKDGPWGTFDSVSDSMLLNYLKKTGFNVERKIFDIPKDDIRRNLQEWDAGMAAKGDRVWDGEGVLNEHSARRIARKMLEDPYCREDKLQEALNMPDGKYTGFKEGFLEKLNTEGSHVTFSGLEERAADYLAMEFCFGRNGGANAYYYKPWFFPLSMSEGDVTDAVQEAYESARMRSQRIIPDKYDYTNICGWSHWINYGIECWQSLYQGRAGNMTIRFLFDFEEMKIITAYPVYREAVRNPHYSISGKDDPYYEGD